MEDRILNYRQNLGPVHENTINYDFKLLFPVLILVGIGTVMVYSASSALAAKKFSTDLYFLKKQGISAGVGLFALVFCRYCPLEWIRKSTYYVLGLAFILLILVQFTDLGVKVGGARRWMRVHGVSFQPSEFARFAMVVFLAYSLSKKKEQIRDLTTGFLPHIIVLMGFTALIILQPDFGSVMILAMLTWIMLYVGGASKKHLFLTLALALPLLLFFLFGEEYRRNRMMAFWDPWAYAADGGYQIIHSLMAFGTGGLIGTGIGKGYQKLFYLPEPHTDFIFSVVGEELGLIGVVFILCMFVSILYFGIRIALNARNLFGLYLAVGITLSIALQASVNIGVSLALLPTKGLTLPFISYGGTSLVLNMTAIGILMNIGVTDSV